MTQAVRVFASALHEIAGDRLPAQPGFTNGIRQGSVSECCMPFSACLFSGSSTEARQRHHASLTMGFEIRYQRHTPFEMRNVFFYVIPLELHCVMGNVRYSVDLPGFYALEFVAH